MISKLETFRFIRIKPKSNFQDVCKKLHQRVKDYIGVLLLSVKISILLPKVKFSLHNYKYCNKKLYLIFAYHALVIIL